MELDKAKKNNKKNMHCLFKDCKASPSIKLRLGHNTIVDFMDTS